MCCCLEVSLGNVIKPDRHIDINRNRIHFLSTFQIWSQILTCRGEIDEINLICSHIFNQKVWIWSKQIDKILKRDKKDGLFRLNLTFERQHLLDFCIINWKSGKVFTRNIMPFLSIFRATTTMFWTNLMKIWTSCWERFCLKTKSSLRVQLQMGFVKKEEISFSDRQEHSTMVS